MIVAVCGLEREAKIAASPEIATVVGGANSRALRERLASTLSSGVQGIISIGIAGALSPELKPGDCVIASVVLTRDHCFDTDAQWAARMMARLPHAKLAPVAASDAALITAADKARLFQTTQAYAVDMESHIAAEFAAQRKLPFAALRVIADSARSDLPACAAVAIDARGRINVHAVLWSIVKRPQQIPRLKRIARESNAAFEALLRCRRLLGGRLLGPDRL